MRRISVLHGYRPPFLGALLGVIIAGLGWPRLFAQEKCEPVPPALRSQLESVYSAWRISMSRSDLRGWVRNTAQARQIAVRNSIVSQKRDWPRSLFALVIVPPEVTTLRVAGSEWRGQQARIVYYGTVDFSLNASSKLPENALMLEFVKEPTGWKFLMGRYYNLENDPDLRRQVADGNISKLYDPEEALTGQAPPPPAICPVPDYAGQLEVHSHGYKTKVTLGEHHRSTITSQSRTDVIIGGLKKGITPMKLEVTPLSSVPESERYFHVRVHAITPRLRTESVCVLEYKPEAAPATSSEHQILVGPATLQKGNEAKLRLDE